MTDGRRVAYHDLRAPMGSFRVVFWRERNGEVYESFVDDDFTHRKEALARAKSAAVDNVLTTAVFDCRGQQLWTSKRAPARAEFTRPASVTKLAGFTEHPPTGRYRR